MPVVETDVVVVGAGIAGISAAREARTARARLSVIEKSPEAERGSNTRYSGCQFRLPHDPDEFSPIGTTNEQMVEDFMRVTHRRADRDLIEVLVGDARESVRKR